MAASDLVRRGVIQVMEGRHCFEHLTIEENLLTGSYTRRDGRAAQWADLERVYAYFPRLKERRRSQAGFTSGGEQQMCAIGRALMSRPSVILLDEPSMGLAPQLVEEIFEIIKRLNREEEVSILLAEQNANMALRYSDYGYILESGRIVMDGDAGDLAQNKDVREFYLGMSEGERKSFRGSPCVQKTEAMVELVLQSLYRVESKQKEVEMKITRSLAAACVATCVGFTGTAAAYELTIPMLAYRTGPYAPGGIPAANGYSDYFSLLNERDGGINGAPVRFVECETAYNTKQGVECYEKLKNEGDSGSLVFQPLSTGITYQLIPKASEDRIPIFSMGYGRTSAANGRVFPWVFNFPATYWDQASVFVKFIGERHGGMDQLNGKKIALVYHNSAYGKEPIPTLEALSAKHGFTFCRWRSTIRGRNRRRRGCRFVVSGRIGFSYGDGA